jgi:hypothetical protein
LIDREGKIMKERSIDDSGIKLLLQKYRNIFQISENLNHYSKADYKFAETKFLKYALGQTKVVDQR